MKRGDARLFYCALLGIALTLEITRKGVPTLRHDWFWVGDRGGFLATIWDSFGGWISGGIGELQTHPTGYVMACVIALLVFSLGPTIALIVVVFLSGLFLALAGWRIAEHAGGGMPVLVGSAIFVVFNPWVYTEIVAGHIFMIVAYASFIMLVSELLRSRPNSYALALLVLLTLQQLQFFLITLIVIGAWAMVRREGRIAAATAAVTAMPTVVGVIADRSALLAIPYNLVWQRSQSVDPVQALTLQGYFAKYTADFSGISTFALWGVVAIAAVGAFLACRNDPRWIAATLATLLFWVCAGGVKGPTAAVYRFLVLHFPVSGVYRELYDLLAFIAIGYVLLGSIAASQIKVLGWFWLVASCAVALAWITSPPAKFWIGWQWIPNVAVGADSNSRFALLPPFQPLSFHGEGAGLDPAAYIRPGNRVPINGETLSYPVDVALASYVQHGDTTALAGLSVSEVLGQPWLRSDLPAIVEQFARSEPPHLNLTAEPRRIRDYLPELSSGPLPHVGAIANHLGFGEVLFADVAGLRGPGVPHAWQNLTTLRVVQPSNEYLRASDGWVDVRQIFASQPELGQGIGGALTTSRDAALTIRGGRETLVFVRGSLIASNGKALLRSSGGYRWMHLPAFVRGVRCDGECVVVAQGFPPKLVSDSATPAPRRGIAFKMFAPWFITAEVPASGKASMLRYNVRFNSHWASYIGGRLLPHFRVDSAVNGWVLPAHSRTKRIYLVEYIALLQGVFELLAIIWAIEMVRRFAKQQLPSRREPRQYEIRTAQVHQS